MNILVYADWFDLKGAILMGVLSVTHVKDRASVSFAYDAGWLKSGHRQNLDPDLKQVAGPQILSPGKKNFGFISDASTDEWGQNLLKRHELLSAQMKKRKPKALHTEDFLMGVYDTQRRGALRFKQTEDGPFLQDNELQSAPPWTATKELEFASLQLEKDPLTDPEAVQCLNKLLAPGASLGGSRPKAGVTDDRGNLWIAKFPQAADKTDSGAWEMLANEMAKDAGIEVADAQAKQFNSRHHVYLSKRFDRIGTKRRIHFASAGTLLGLPDMAKGVSYIDIAGFIIKNGASVKSDLEELWRRIVFNIAIKNTGDHLQNHGFLLGVNGWSLSPAYDINPDPDGKNLTLNISKSDNDLDFALALSVAKYFRVEKDAESIIKTVKRAVSKWNKLAKKYGLPADELARMSAAFEQDG